LAPGRWVFFSGSFPAPFPDGPGWPAVERPPVVDISLPPSKLHLAYGKQVFCDRETPMNDTVLISGASIAGPSLAYWLNRCGFRPTVIEKASTVRPGGYPIDLRGIAIEVIDRM